jgi:RES domain-containing protein
VSISAWRIVKRRLAADAFSGEGARLYGGRWNAPGTRVVYVAESQSLAALEILVHLESAQALEHYVLIEVKFDSALVTAVEKQKLPANWQAEPAPISLRAIGDDWTAAGISAVLKVPSAIVPHENNFLLNPAHADFSKIQIERPIDFALDPRLMRKR